MKALVTGASRGIGRAIAAALLARGDTVVLVARNASNLTKLAAEHPDLAHVVVSDLAQAGEAERIVERGAALVDELDALVCAAGVAEHRPALSVDHAQLELHLRTNFIAPVLSSIAFARRPASQQRTIVHVASTLALGTAELTLAYAASKAALVSATKSLAAELGTRGVRVNAIAPGLVDTDMIAGRDHRELARMHPLGRLGTVEDIADAALYLLDAEWVTGTVHVVDGGLLLSP